MLLNLLQFLIAFRVIMASLALSYAVLVVKEKSTYMLSKMKYKKINKNFQGFIGIIFNSLDVFVWIKFWRICLFLS